MSPFICANANVGRCGGGGGLAEESREYELEEPAEDDMEYKGNEEQEATAVI